MDPLVHLRGHRSATRHHAAGQSLGPLSGLPHRAEILRDLGLSPVPPPSTEALARQARARDGMEAGPALPRAPGLLERVRRMLLRPREI